ncbi:MAG: FmdB family zinc ribbon protein [Acidimicrobiales bacterium]
MPVYEYACRACGKHVEVAQSFTDEPLTTCDRCGGPLRKVFGSVGVVLKGSGFYRTDSRDESRARAKSEKSDTSDSKTEAKSDGKSETKSDAKSDSSKPDSTPAAKAAEKSAKSA